MAKKLAIGSWAYCFGPYADNPVSLEETVGKLAELKFDGIELCGFPPHANPDDYATKDDRQKLRDLISGKGLGIAGYAANFMDVPPATASGEDYLACFGKNVQMCVDLGIPKIRVDTVSPPPYPQGMAADEGMKKIAGVWNQAAQLAQDNGILMVWEFEPGFAYNKPSEVVRMIDAVDHPNFTILYDACHAHMCAVVAARQAEPVEKLKGGAVEFAGMLKGKIGHIHLIDSDNTLHDDETSTHAPFGQGVLDFDKIMPAILDAGYTDEWWSVDLCFWPQAWDVTAEAKKFLDGLREKYG
ncbi:MAG: sugar phosphate isomerase/epimerase [Planctomycetes bacterium]|nr:sugar phosphate isomerase/epimerase [Planctomycetota bacterium]